MTWQLTYGRLYDCTNDMAGCVGTDVDRYRWTSQSVTCGTTARVTRGTMLYVRT
jgi:hypothetical protein